MQRGIEIKTPDQIAAMRRAGLVVSAGLEAMAAVAQPGVTTADIADVGRDVLARAGAVSSFLHYGAVWGAPPYPSVVCLSPNDVVVHGIPGPTVLRDGDIISIDFGAIVDGWHGDAARTVAVGSADAAAMALVEASRQAMWAGIAAIRPGARIGDVSSAVASSIEAQPARYGIVRDYTGHGIGTAMHQAPDVPNWGRPHRGPRIVVGMALCVEPMLTMGTEQVFEQDDGWTVKTGDGKWASHWEDTIAVMAGGLWVLTEPEGGKAELEARGLKYAGDRDLGT